MYRDGVRGIEHQVYSEALHVRTSVVLGKGARGGEGGRGGGGEEAEAYVGKVKL